MIESFVKGFKEMVQNTKLAVISVMALVLGFVAEMLYIFTGKYDFLSLDFFVIKLFEETLLALLMGALLIPRRRENPLSLLVFSAFYGLTISAGFSLFVLPGFVAFMFLFFAPLLSVKNEPPSSVLEKNYRMVFKGEKTADVFLSAAVVFIVWFIPYLGSIISNLLRVVLVYSMYRVMEGSYEKTESDAGSA
ncbi:MULTISPECIES: hypothetical protein [unclassified Thermotoga]|uniref:hypothetical protein n=1 Tax=unclassified Thermotoga TaxID=2631113 RepID=UPI000280E7FB|nr:MULTISPECIES: hypothetical protein [unclassified Thermotoga]AIY87083.1 hypothetical protein T2812B_07780 [Thermotoga sp. 2812B]EJX25800.1 hypothetical protein EMP_08432 [Thermotoga sp. EMP]